MPSDPKPPSRAYLSGEQISAAVRKVDTSYPNGLPAAEFHKIVRRTVSNAATEQAWPMAVAEAVEAAAGLLRVAIRSRNRGYVPNAQSDKAIADWNKFVEANHG